MEARRIFVSTVFKSGTILLRRIVEALTDLEPVTPLKDETPDYGSADGDWFARGTFYCGHHVPTEAVKARLRRDRARPVFLVRNIYDLLVAQYHHFADDVDHAIGRGTGTRDYFASMSRNEGLAMLLSGCASTELNFPGFGLYLFQMQEMLRFAQTYPCCVVSYERLVDDKLNELARLAVFLGQPVCQERFERIAEATSFSRMRQLNDPNVAANAHFRKGRPGAHSETLADFHYHMIDHLLESHAPDLVRLCMMIGFHEVIERRTPSARVFVRPRLMLESHDGGESMPPFRVATSIPGMDVAGASFNIDRADSSIGLVLSNSHLRVNRAAGIRLGTHGELTFHTGLDSDGELINPSRVGEIDAGGGWALGGSPDTPSLRVQPVAGATSAVTVAGSASGAPTIAASGAVQSADLQLDAKDGTVRLSGGNGRTALAAGDDGVQVGAAVGAVSGFDLAIATDAGCGRGAAVQRAADSASPASLALRKARGDSEAPSAVEPGDGAGRISICAHDGEDYREVAALTAVVREVGDTGGLATDFVIHVASADGDLTERLRVAPDGTVTIGGPAAGEGPRARADRNGVNAVEVRGSGHDRPVAISAAGADTDVDLELAPKGRGALGLAVHRRQLAMRAGHGKAARMPGRPAGYLRVVVNGKRRKIPYFRD